MVGRRPPAQRMRLRRRSGARKEAAEELLGVGLSRGLACMDLGCLMAQKCDNLPSDGVGWWGGGCRCNGRVCGVDRVPKEEAAEEVQEAGAGRGLAMSV